MRKNNFYLALLFCLLNFNLVISQSIFVNNQDETTSDYTLEDVRRLTFEDQNLVLLLYDDTSFSFALADLANYSYDVNLSAANFIEQINTWDLNVYPNPTKDIINVQFRLIEAAQLWYNVVDLKGRSILNATTKQFNQGKNNFSFSMDGFAPGTYVLQIQGKSVLINHKILKQ